MNALSIGWKKTKVIFCCTYCLWRVGTSVGRWEGSVHWLKVLNPGLGFSLPRGGLNTAGFGVGHLGSVHCALWLSHWNWETPSWGVQVAGDRQHEERERECAREKREREDSARDWTQHRDPRSSEKRPTKISPVVRNLVHRLPRVWVTSVRGRTENLSSGRKESIKVWKRPFVLLHAHRGKTKLKQTSSICFVRFGHYLLQRRKISRATMWVCHFQSLPWAARGLTESRERSGSGRGGGLESKRGSVTGREGGTGLYKVSN